MQCRSAVLAKNFGPVRQLERAWRPSTVLHLYRRVLVAQRWRKCQLYSKACIKGYSGRSRTYVAFHRKFCWSTPTGCCSLYGTWIIESTTKSLLSFLTGQSRAKLKMTKWFVHISIFQSEFAQEILSALNIFDDETSAVRSLIQNRSTKTCTVSHFFVWCIFSAGLVLKMLATESMEAKQ